MIIREISSNNREKVNQLIIDSWHSIEMIVRGEIIDMSKIEGFIALEKDHVVGLITYRIIENRLEITSLNSYIENKGVGTKLVDTIIDHAKLEKCHRIVLITTNDNLKALKFYQKRGFELVCIYRNALNISRKLKPSIPLIGENGIPLRDEIELEYMCF